jgi:type 1 fimbria pilin
MTSSTLRALGCLVLTLSAGIITAAQNQPPKKPSSISGKVTFKGNGLSGITVGAIFRGSITGKTRFSAVTDTQGNYRISDLPPGNYELSPVAPQFVASGLIFPKRVFLDEGETLDGMDFSLVRGGVISGKVTNSDGQALIEEPVQLSVPEGKPVERTEQTMRLNMYFYQTDDRGMYRIYGLPAGKYIVSTGTPDHRVTFSSRAVKYKQTFHPSVTDASQATVIDVTEGSEATNVDIVISLRQTTYSVSGRIVDGETGKPIPNARYGLTKFDEHGSSGTSGPVTNALGEFKIEALLPGKYIVSLEQRAINDPFAEKAGNVFAEAVRFEITDQDITDLVIKTGSGASVSGLLVFDGLDQKTARQKFGELMIMVYLPSSERYGGSSNARPVRVGADGGFTVGGLAAGEVQFSIFAPGSSDTGRRFEVARVERDGLVQQRNLEIKDREQVTGVRLIVNARSGTLQGIVKLENGQIDSGRLQVSLMKTGERSGYGMMVDARGRFQMRGLPAGTYEITAVIYMPNAPNPPMTKQQIVINDDQVTEVTLTLDLKSRLTPDRP